MELIDVTEENIEREHICCAIADSEFAQKRNG